MAPGPVFLPPMIQPTYVGVKVFREVQVLAPPFRNAYLAGILSLVKHCVAL